MLTHKIVLAREFTHHDETGERTLRPGPQMVTKSFADAAAREGALIGKAQRIAPPAAPKAPKAPKARPAKVQPKPAVKAPAPKAKAKPATKAPKAPKAPARKR